MEELYGAVAAVPLNRLLGEAGAIIFCLGIALVLLVFTFGINISEIIIVDLESTDNTLNILKTFSKDFDFIKVLTLNEYKELLA